MRGTFVFHRLSVAGLVATVLWEGAGGCDAAQRPSPPKPAGTAAHCPGPDMNA